MHMRTNVLNGSVVAQQHCHFLIAACHFLSSQLVHILFVDIHVAKERTGLPSLSSVLRIISFILVQQERGNCHNFHSMLCSYIVYFWLREWWDVFTPWG